MANDVLVQTVKKIYALVRSGNLDEAYLGYGQLFSDPAFLTYRIEDQRQALRLMVMAKGVPIPLTSAMIEAHRAAVIPLTELVSKYSEPSDHEMLGICHVMLGNVESADKIFRAGLRLERERSPQSDLCGSFMKRIATL